MQNTLLNFDSPEIPAKAISPLLELGAYEMLWLEHGASVKSIASRLHEAPEALLSDLVNPTEAMDTAHHVLDVLRKKGIKQFGVRIHRAGEYSLKLRDAKYPVELLYYRGFWDLVETPCIAVVGTRKPSQDGIEQARALVKYLVREKWTIVSGLAEGIDTVAHRTTLEERGNTIAVIGTPICDIYPKQNEALQNHIASKYLVISQVPVLRYYQQIYKQNRLFFPERNITMSALTEGTIIVEAGNTSGTLIQAKAAIQQGRKLFIMDQCFKNPELTWPRKLEESGAIRVKDLAQIKDSLSVGKTTTD
ncbi:MAG: DNA-processing protein DprA [Nitrospira sp.]|nr:MAG: DNA-processing protein DprA [Nitrospira sp.]